MAQYPHGTSPSTSSGDGHKAAWITGICGIVAALITAIAGYGFGNARGQEIIRATPTVTVTATVTATVEPSAGSAAGDGSDADPADPTKGSVFYEGLVTLDQGSTDQMKDLDTYPPAVTSEDVAGDLSVRNMDSDSGTFVDWDNTTPIALWTGDAVPTYAECKDAASAQGTTEVSDVEIGTILCVQTDEGRIARLEITEIREFEAMTADVTVWES